MASSGVGAVIGSLWLFSIQKGRRSGWMRAA